MFCTLCLHSAVEDGPSGPVCQNCHSFQRHRVMQLMAMVQVRARPRGTLVLDMSPLAAMDSALRSKFPDSYVSMNIRPEPHISMIADLGRLPLPDRSVGFIQCSHVLEHVHDDRAAMLELRRVLAPGAEILIQVPRRVGSATEEGLDLSPEERLARFGQADHVRYYGDDLEDRLSATGLRVKTVRYQDLLPIEVLGLIGVTSNHELWIAGDRADESPALVSKNLMDALGERVADLDDRLEDATLETANAANTAERYRNQYEWLANRRLVRVARSIKASVTNLGERARVKGRDV